MDNKKIMASIAMFALLTIPALFGYCVGVTYWKAYLIALVTTLTVMVVSSIIEYLIQVYAAHKSK